MREEREDQLRLLVFLLSQELRNRFLVETKTASLSMEFEG